MKRGLRDVSLFKTPRLICNSRPIFFCLCFSLFSWTTHGQIFSEKLSGFNEPTDIQFLPGSNQEAIILEKTGTAKRWHLPANKVEDLFKVTVLTASEQGLLGMAFHPDFNKNGRFFINVVVRSGKKDVTRVDEWNWQPAKKITPSFKQTILEQEQPYVNHNAGQLAFGPDGFLYVGFGDGGSRNDPLLAGQDLKTWLGKMLRIDVNNTEQGKHYAVPKDNPFIGRANARPEIWAYGLRNPWRYSFDGKGRLFVGDVGQDASEEISIVRRGGNYGWNIMEAEHCFSPKKGCKTTDLELPILSYGRKDGVSITGGFVYEGKKLKNIRGKYIFADFGMGKIWAMTPPAGDRVTKTSQAKELLYDCRCTPSTFGRNADGELYMADFASGKIFSME